VFQSPTDESTAAVATTAWPLLLRAAGASGRGGVCVADSCDSGPPPQGVLKRRLS